MKLSSVTNRPDRAPVADRPGPKAVADDSPEMVKRRMIVGLIRLNQMTRRTVSLTFKISERTLRRWEEDLFGDVTPMELATPKSRPRPRKHRRPNPDAMAPQPFA